MPWAPARSNGDTAPTVQTRISRPCESRLICTASSSTCRSTTPPRRNSDLCREGIPTMESSSTGSTLCGLEFLQSHQIRKTALVDANLPQQLEIAQHFAGAQHHGRQRVIGDGNREAGFFADALVEILQKRAAAGQDDAAVADVGGKFWRSAFQSHANGI